MNRCYAFAHLIARDLREGTVETVRGAGFVVSGRLDIGPILVGIKIEVPWRFQQVKRLPPTIFCLEPWMKSGPDWHNGPPLCWTLPNLWRDCMTRRQKSVASIMSEGWNWMRNNVSALVAKHYDAELRGLKEWQPEWDFWGHGAKGVIEYKSEQRQCRANNIARKRQGAK